MPDPIRIVLFGAAGMVGQGALRECLSNPRVGQVVSVVRKPTGRQHRKPVEILLADLAAIATIEDRLDGFDACLFCGGVTAAGLSEQAYTRITYDLTPCRRGRARPAQPGHDVHLRDRRRDRQHRARPVHVGTRGEYT
jgi:nucleoside-diphosphate-sugar epimerase